MNTWPLVTLTTSQDMFLSSTGACIQGLGMEPHPQTFFIFLF